LEKVKIGFANLERHIENAKKFGIVPVVAINHYLSDNKQEK
jgi:formate--tetrahydrofolate ligase